MVCRVSAARHSADLGSLPSVGRPALGETAVTVTTVETLPSIVWLSVKALPSAWHSAKLSSPALALPSVSGQISVYLLLVKY